MGLADALAEIVADWPRVSAQLSDQSRADVRRQLAAAVHGSSWRPSLLLGLLVGDQPRHPAWAALRSGSRRTTLPSLEPESAALRLRWLLELDDQPDTPTREASPSWQDVAYRAELRIWLAPMRPTPAGAEGILRLNRDGENVAPAFQFDDDAQPLAAVLEVNRALNATEDPWGAASWWLAPHAALHAIPADAVRHGRADEVLAAALTSVLEE